MTEALVTGTDAILESYGLPFLPMVHCFLAYEKFRVDLTEGNHNGKNRSIDTFLYTQAVQPNISAKDEYRLFRSALETLLSSHPKLTAFSMKSVLHAREEGLKLLRANIS